MFLRNKTPHQLRNEWDSFSLDDASTEGWGLRLSPEKEDGVFFQSEGKLAVCLHSDLSSNQLSALPLAGLQSLTHLRLAGNTQLMEVLQREDLPRVR